MAGTKRKGRTSVPNALLSDDRLSIGARGAMAWILSHGGGFKLHRSGMMQAFGVGRTAFDRIMRELKAAGYINTITKHVERGHFNSIYVVLSEVGLSDCGWPDHLSITIKEELRFLEVFPRAPEDRALMLEHLDAAIADTGEDEVLAAAKRYAQEVRALGKTRLVSLPENWLRDERYVEVIDAA